MRLQALSDDGVLDGDIGRQGAFVVPTDGEALVAAPEHGEVVEDHVAAIGNACSILAAGAALTHTEAHVAHDDIVGTRERHAVAIDLHTLSWSRLSQYGQVLGKDQTTCQFDDATDIEDDDTVRLADSIAKRARARVVQVGDVVNGASTSTGCETTKTFRTGECQLLGTHSGADSEQC